MSVQFCAIYALKHTISTVKTRLFHAMLTDRFHGNAHAIKTLLSGSSPYIVYLRHAHRGLSSRYLRCTMHRQTYKQLAIIFTA